MSYFESTFFETAKVLLGGDKRPFKFYRPSLKLKGFYLVIFHNFENKEVVILLRYKNKLEEKPIDNIIGQFYLGKLKRRFLNDRKFDIVGDEQRFTFNFNNDEGRGYLTIIKNGRITFKNEMDIFEKGMEPKEMFLEFFTETEDEPELPEILENVNIERVN